MKKKQTLFTILTLLALIDAVYASKDNSRSFQYYCQQNSQDTQSQKKYTFISNIFTVNPRYANYCYEANLKRHENKFENYLSREYDHLNIENGIATCFCFKMRSSAIKNYRINVNRLRSTSELKLYLIRTFPN
jgi:hypothetical protein